MKKIVALMLSSVMLLSVLSVIPSAVLADGTGGASDVIADINFETQEQKDYYTVDNKTNTQIAIATCNNSQKSND